MEGETLRLKEWHERLEREKVNREQFICSQCGCYRLKLIKGICERCLRENIDESDN